MIIQLSIYKIVVKLQELQLRQNHKPLLTVTQFIGQNLQLQKIEEKKS